MMRFKIALDFATIATCAPLYKALFKRHQCFMFFSNVNQFFGCVTDAKCL